MDLVAGRNSAFVSYKVDHPVSYTYDIKSKDFPISDSLFQAFKKYAVEKYNTNPAQIDKEKEFIERSLRTELVTAAYGSTTSLQVFNDYDNQLQKAIELLPQAKQLALEGAKANALKQNALNR
jgi:hypothetical protein